jgi:uncharacterized protein YprB with RNaseH-like and TPR domain
MFLDIETTSTKGDTGQITAIGIIKDSRIEVKFVERPENEKEVLEWFKKELTNCDTIITWFGSGFDIPYLLSRAVINDIDLHEIMQIHSLDLCRFCQEHFSLAKYSLAEVAKSLGIKKNTEINWKDMLVLYIKAMNGNKKAKETIIEHCKDDLDALKKIYEKLEPYLLKTDSFK